MFHAPRTDLVALFEKLPKRCVKPTRHPCVFTVRPPLLPFFAARAESGRRRFVQALRRRFPHGLLRLVDWNGEEWRDLGHLVHRGDGTLVVRLRQSISTEDLLARLYEGGWTLILFQQYHHLKGAALPERVPTDALGLFGVLDILGAAAIILSWPDDLEWSLALTPT